MSELLRQWQMTEVDGEFQLTESPLPEPTEDEALIKVAGCGVCHTDISFWHYGVKTKRELPLTLGHEISGQVIKGPKELMGKNVIIPAVLPCGECELCQGGRSNICQNQVMPGNDLHGGFASHVAVPHRFLCVVPDSILKKYPLANLAVIADAISTPYQVIEKSELKKGDLAIVIGVGGVGMYGALIAAIKGAMVIALDIDEKKLESARSHGVHATLNTKGMGIREVKASVREIAADLKASRYGWKIFEFSGTAAGQESAFNLLTFASTFSVVGFTLDKLNVRLSNLMAFDAKLIGTWGCKPELYPEVINLIDSGKLDISDFVSTYPLSEINEVFSKSLKHAFNKRPVLVPDFN